MHGSVPFHGKMIILLSISAQMVYNLMYYTLTQHCGQRVYWQSVKVLLQVRSFCLKVSRARYSMQHLHRKEKKNQRRNGLKRLTCMSMNWSDMILTVRSSKNWSRFLESKCSELRYLIQDVNSMQYGSNRNTKDICPWRSVYQEFLARWSMQDIMQMKYLRQMQHLSWSRSCWQKMFTKIYRINWIWWSFRWKMWMVRQSIMNCRKSIRPGNSMWQDLIRLEKSSTMNISSRIRSTARRWD